MMYNFDEYNAGPGYKHCSCQLLDQRKRRNLLCATTKIFGKRVCIIIILDNRFYAPVDILSVKIWSIPGSDRKFLNISKLAHVSSPFGSFSDTFCSNQYYITFKILLKFHNLNRDPFRVPANSCSVLGITLLSSQICHSLLLGVSVAPKIELLFCIHSHFLTAFLSLK